jgi:hypothetical protein
MALTLGKYEVFQSHSLGRPKSLIQCIELQTSFGLRFKHKN